MPFEFIDRKREKNFEKRRTVLLSSFVLECPKPDGQKNRLLSPGFTYVFLSHSLIKEFSELCYGDGL